MAASRVQPARGRRGWQLDGRVEQWGLPVATALLVVAVGGLLAHYALAFWLQAIDEDGYRSFGLYTVDHLPSSLWDLNRTSRGPQRLEAWVLGASLELFGSPAGFRVARLLNIAAFCSTALPVWLWIRRLGVWRPLAALGALLAILVPWAFLTSAYLTENLAYPAGTWALFAIWAAAARPRVRTILLAVLAVAVATLARSVMALLFIALAVTLAASVARFAGPRTWRDRRTWTRREVAPWALLGGAALVAALTLLLKNGLLDSIFGTYAGTGNIQSAVVVPTAKRVLANVFSGVGVLPAILALAWVGRSLVRPADAGAWSLAVLAPCTAVFVVYGALRGGADERYVMYLAPVLIVCACVAVGRREIGWVAIAVATAVVLWLFGDVTWRADQQAYGFFIQSAESFHARVMLLGLGARLPNIGLSYPVVLGVLIAAVAAITALALRRRLVAVGVALALGLLVVQLAQLTYVDRHFTTEASTAPLSSKTWVDNAIGDDARAALFLAPWQGDTAVLNEAWRQTAFWNLSVYGVPVVMSSPKSWLPNSWSDGYVEQAQVDPRTGAISAPSALPEHMIEATGAPVAPLVGTVKASAGSLRLIRVTPPARVAWRMSGLTASGAIQPAHPARIDIFRANGAGECLTMEALASNDLSGPAIVRLRSGADRVRVRLTAGQRVTAAPLRLHPATAERFAPIQVLATVRSGQQPDPANAVFTGGVVMPTTATRGACP